MSSLSQLSIVNDFRTEQITLCRTEEKTW